MIWNLSSHCVTLALWKCWPPRDSGRKWVIHPYPLACPWYISKFQISMVQVSMTKVITFRVCLAQAVCVDDSRFLKIHPPTYFFSSIFSFPKVWTQSWWLLWNLKLMMCKWLSAFFYVVQSSWKLTRTFCYSFWFYIYKDRLIQARSFLIKVVAYKAPVKHVREVHRP